MNWILLLRKCLMAELCDPSFSVGGLVRMLLGIDGTLATAEDVRPHEGFMTIAFYNRSLAAFAEILLHVKGLGAVPIKIPFMGKTDSPDHVTATQGDCFGRVGLSGYIPSSLIPLPVVGRMVSRDVSQGRLGAVEHAVEGRGFATFHVDFFGENPPALISITMSSRFIVPVGATGRLLMAYRYTVEENEAGGLTYRITSDCTEQTDGTLRIGV